jgi:hypothetical protein
MKEASTWNFSELFNYIIFIHIHSYVCKVSRESSCESRVRVPIFTFLHYFSGTAGTKFWGLVQLEKKYI